MGPTSAERQDDRNAEGWRLRTLVNRNTATLAAIEDVAEQRLSQGRIESAIAWVRIGAIFATANPTTSYRSLRLDRVLDAISHRHLPPSSPSRSGEVGSVLHVFTEGPATGGHLRFAVRWVEVDRERRSSFVVTRPGMGEEILNDVASRHGGTSTVLSGSEIERAASLRSMAADVDLVVCHTHMDDVVPGLAFGGEYDGSPVILMNHADHVFNLGGGNISLIVSPRSTGAEFAAAVRHYPAEYSKALPVPMADMGRGMERAEAKRRLGLAPDRVVALTLARPPKYVPSRLHPGFVDVVEPTLAERDAVLFAVGPEPDDPVWSGAIGRLGDRLRVEGMQPDPGVYLDAADVYVDSIPFCSITSLLEAGVRGTPVITHRPHQGHERLHSSEGMLEEAIVASHDVSEHRRLFGRLLDDADHRAQVGAATAAAVTATHALDAWKATLEELYAAAVGNDPLRDRTEIPGDLDAVADYAVALAGMETHTPLLWPIRGAIIGGRDPRFDRNDRINAQLRVTLARAAVRIGRRHFTGAEAATLLIPGSRRHLRRV